MFVIHICDYLLNVRVYIKLPFSTIIKVNYLEVKILNEDPQTMDFSIKGIYPSVANALRRYSINSVKTFAIDTVTFYENSSPMFDEYIAHRIGLIPMKTPKGFNDNDNIMLSLEATGPTVVYSRDLITTEPNVNVASENIPIIKLGKEQRLRIDCKAVMGTALQHAKYQPGITTYNNSKDTFNFYVESFGQLPPKEIIKKACDALINDLNSVLKVAKKL